MRLTSPLRGFAKIRFYRDARYVLSVAVVVNAIQWLIVVLRVKPSVVPIALHYTTTFGIDRIGHWYLAYLLPASGTAILIMNMVLSSLTVEHQRTSSSIIVYLTLLMECMILASVVLIFWRL